MDPCYLAKVFLVHLFFPSVLLLFVLTHTQLKRILNFLSISHISMLVGNSINFPLRSHQQPGLSNLGIFTLKAPAQHGEYTGMSWQGARSMFSLSASIPFYIHPGGKLQCTFYLSSGPSAGKISSHVWLVAHLDLFCNVEQPVDTDWGVLHHTVAVCLKYDPISTPKKLAELRFYWPSCSRNNHTGVSSTDN